MQNTNPKEKIATVLIVDDEEFVLDGLELIFNKEGYNVQRAYSAQQAIEILEENVVDIVISDEQMPGMTGTQLLALVNEKWSHIQRIVLSGKGGFDVALKAINQGRVFRFLQKPCDSTLLKDTVREALEEKVLRQSLVGPNESASINDPLNELSSSATRQGLTNHENASLTSREQQILDQMLLGQRISSISEILFISSHTVRNHVKSIFLKLNVHSQIELVQKVRGT